VGETVCVSLDPGFSPGRGQAGTPDGWLALAAEVGVDVGAVVGEPLRLQSRTRKAVGDYQLRTGSGQSVGYVGVFGRRATGPFASGEIAHMASATDAWRLKSDRPWGWELTIESIDGRQVGSYSGRRSGRDSGPRCDLQSSNARRSPHPSDGLMKVLRDVSCNLAGARGPELASILFGTRVAVARASVAAG
jgi:hypothetical protein